MDAPDTVTEGVRQLEADGDDAELALSVSERRAMAVARTAQVT